MLGVMACAYNPNIWKVETEDQLSSGVLGQLEQHSETLSPKKKNIPTCWGCQTQPWETAPPSGKAGAELGQ
jgi:hypothetical protein